MKYSICMGSALGDALGAPFEKQYRFSDKVKSWDGNSFASTKDRSLHTGKVNPGQTTDDYDMTKMLMNSLFKNNGFNPEDLCKDYINWIFNDNAKGYGKTTLNAITNLKNGVSYKESGIPNSWGNGSAMRSAPLGVYYHNDLNKLIEVATIDAKITHNSIEAVAGSVSVALMIYSIINNLDPLATVLSNIQDCVIKDKLSNLPMSMSLEDGLDKVGVGFDVRDTVPAAVLTYLKEPNMSGMVKLIRKCGDADTNASIFGTFLGASKYEFPENLILQLDGYNEVIALDDKVNEYLGR